MKELTLVPKYAINFNDDEQFWIDFNNSEHRSLEGMYLLYEED